MKEIPLGFRVDLRKSGFAPRLRRLKFDFMVYNFPSLSRDELTAIIVALDFYEQYLIQTEYNGNPYSIDVDSAPAFLRELRLKFYNVRSHFFDYVSNIEKTS